MRVYLSAILPIFVLGALQSVFAQEEPCALSRASFARTPVLAVAEAHILCLEGVVAAGAGLAAVPASIWRPVAAVPGEAVPTAPSYHQLQEYLEWVQAQYDWDMSEWTKGVSQTLPADSMIVNYGNGFPPANTEINMRQFMQDPTLEGVLVYTPSDGVVTDLTPEGLGDVQNMIDGYLSSGGLQ